MKKRVLVYPCGTEIGLEIYRAASASTHFELVGGSSSYDHGRFVYEEHIDRLPFITDASPKEEIEAFNQCIKDQHIDYIYPAMDGVIYVFAKYRECLTPVLIAPEFKTAEITRSKKATYEALEGLIALPKQYDWKDQSLEFPLFSKPSVGQGSRGAQVVKNKEALEHLKREVDQDKQLLLEYLPGQEYTIDCFTNNQGELIYTGGRGRRRIKNGISVNAVKVESQDFLSMAKAINRRLRQRGAWFFQVREDIDGRLKLLEVASRIAGTSSYARNRGINLVLMTLFTFLGQNLDSVMENSYTLELDRALYNRYKLDLVYDKVYMDYDDTVTTQGKLNIMAIRFIYQCINASIPIILITKHDTDMAIELDKRRLTGLFDQVIQLDRDQEKYPYIDQDKSIFIDDSYIERKKVFEKRQIPVFEPSMLECLLKDQV